MKKSPDLSQKIRKVLPETGCIVDLGCGDAEFLRTLTSKDYKLIGIDPIITTTLMIERTNPFGTHLASLDSDNASDCPVDNKLLLFHGTAESIPLPDHIADVILMQCVFSLCDEKSAIKEMKRVLKPDGLLIITDLISGTESIIMDFSAHNGLPPRVKRLLTKEDFEKCLLTDFTLLSYSNEKQALIQMMIEAIFSDEEFCITSEEQTELKKHKAGYGMWIFKQKS